MSLNFVLTHNNAKNDDHKDEPAPPADPGNRGIEGAQAQEDFASEFLILS